ncbi:MAG: LLM class F420-dependent oxidoreductase [Deltaproteobacteria bacterium]|nr:LLM class F420-dependent oxidoreductase [Deltaproteobacteria bacterium]
MRHTRTPFPFERSHATKTGVFLPISGRAATPETLRQAARSAEDWGFDSIWAADRIIIPWRIDTPYPYGKDGAFIVPPDRPFLDSLTCLTFLAACTSRVELGISVLVLPYRQPLVWAKIAVTLDHLSEGRFILGVGVGWMEEEFRALQAPFEDRGRRTDEQLEVLRKLWSAEHASFSGEFYEFEDVAFLPKPPAPRGIPVWIGGEGRRAQRRAGRYGDAWFPYFVRIEPDELAARFENARRYAEEAGRPPDAVHLNCCLPIEVTRDPVPQEPDRLAGTPAQLVDAIARYRSAGVEHMALQFMVPRWPDRLEQMQRFAEETLPHIRT